MPLSRSIQLWLLRRRPLWLARLRGYANNSVLEDREFLEHFQQVYGDGTALLSMRELWNLWHFTRQAIALEGACAEVGVFRGGSARMICAAKGRRPLHLFDTFSGMPETNPLVDTHHRRGDFAATSAEGVRRYLEAFENVHLHPGFFPDSAQGTLPDDQRFCFVHLDVDIYESTLAALQFFYPRLVPGGAIISHDYRSLSTPGVRKAFDEFFAHDSSRVIPLWDSQALVWKPASCATDATS
jgi:hypothetical protein